MKKIFSILAITLLLASCVGTDKRILRDSIGKLNKVMVVAKGNDWTGDVGKEVRNSFSELMVGLPQPEPILSVSQVAPNGFSSMMKSSRNIFIISESENEKFSVKRDVYAQPQTVVYIQAKDDASIIKLLQKHKQEIRNTFRESEIKFTQNIFKKTRVDETKYKTIKKLGVSLIIPDKFRTVDDTGEFSTTMKSPYRDDYTFKPSRYPLDDEPLDPNRTMLNTGVFDIPWGERADYSELRIESDDIRPTSILEVEWQAQVTGSRRRV